MLHNTLELIYFGTSIVFNLVVTYQVVSEVLQGK